MSSKPQQWTRRQVWAIHACKAVESAALTAVVGLSYWSWGARTPHPEFELGSVLVVSVAMSAATTIRARLLNRLVSKEDRNGLAYYDGWFRVGWLFVPWISYVLIIAYADTDSDWFPVFVTIAGAAGALLRSLAESVITYPTPSLRTPTPDPPPTVHDLTKRYAAQRHAQKLSDAFAR